MSSDITMIVCTPSARIWCATSGTVSVPSTGWPPVIATASLYRILYVMFDLRRDRLTNRQRSGMEIGAVAEILENVLRLGERRLAAPRRAFAAHLREGFGAAVHPRHHVVTADAAERARAFRNRRRCIVRAARAECAARGKFARGSVSSFSFSSIQRSARRDRIAREELAEPFRDHLRDHRRRQFVRRQATPMRRIRSYLPIIDGRVGSLSNQASCTSIPSSAIR